MLMVLESNYSVESLTLTSGAKLYKTLQLEGLVFLSSPRLLVIVSVSIWELMKKTPSIIAGRGLLLGVQEVEMKNDKRYFCPGECVDHKTNISHGYKWTV